MVNFFKRYNANNQYEIFGGVFKQFNGRINNIKLETAVINDKYLPEYFFIGKLQNDLEFAISIGLNEEWLSVFAPTRHKEVRYERHGYSIYDNRFSYGLRPLGGQEIKEHIQKYLPEIKARVNSLSIKRNKYLADKNIKEQEKLNKEAEAQRLSVEIEKDRLLAVELIKPIIPRKFTGFNVKFNKNKAYHEKALRLSRSDYPWLDIDINSQTCNCEDYIQYNANYEINDVRRFCRHLWVIARHSYILARNNNPMLDFIQDSRTWSIHGIYSGNLDNGKTFCVITNYLQGEFQVATPKLRSENEFIMVNWRIRNSVWTPSGGSKLFNAQIKLVLESFFE